MDEPNWELELSLKLTLQEVELLAQALAERPFKEVAQLMTKMQGQVTPQIQADKEKNNGTGRSPEEKASSPEGV